VWQRRLRVLAALRASPALPHAQLLAPVISIKAAGRSVVYALSPPSARHYFLGNFK